MATGTPPAAPPAAPHGLDLVIDFVNTLDVEKGTDLLATPGALGEWLRGRGLAPSPPRAPGESDLRAALALRETLREVMESHNGAPPADGAERVLEGTARRGELAVGFGAGGTVRLAPRAGGVDGALAALLVPVAHAIEDGTWQRVKACRAPDCRWAFYDRSRNRSGTWCDMAVCGNRTKVRSYRRRSGRGG